MQGSTVTSSDSFNNNNAPNNEQIQVGSSSQEDIDKEQDQAQLNSNKQMGGIGINFLKGILPTKLVPKYFDSEWSFAQVRGIEGK